MFQAAQLSQQHPRQDLDISQHAFFKKGHISSADHPGVFHESKSDRCALVYIMKLIELPPPRVPPHGTIGSRFASCLALFPL